MIQLQNFCLLIIFLVVVCGTAAPVLFQWLVSRDVSTGAPSSNGSIIPIPISSFTLIVYLHWRNLLRAMNKGKSGVLVRGSGPVLFPDVRSSYELRAMKALFVFVPFIHFLLLSCLCDFSSLESLCGVLCLLFFCTLLYRSSAQKGERRSSAYERISPSPKGNEQRRKAGQGCIEASHRERRVEVLSQPSAYDACVGEPLTLPRSRRLASMSVDYYQKVPMSMTLGHVGVCVGILGVALSNSKKVQFTQRLPLGGELHMGNERCSFRGIDHLHGPTSHSICGNFMISKPSTEGLLFDVHADLLPSNAKVEHLVHWWNQNVRQHCNGVTMFPEKRYFRERTSTAEVAIHTNLFTDLYALIGTGNGMGGWYTTMMKLPFIFLIWIGFLLASLGGLPSLLRQLKRERLRWN